MSKRSLLICTLCISLSSCVLFEMPEYQPLQVGEYELADVDYNTLNIYTDWLNPIVSEPVISASLSIQEADESEFGTDPEVVETLKTTNRYVVNGDEIRYRRVHFENIRTENHVITSVSCKLRDRGSGWAKQTTDARITHKQLYSCSFKCDDIAFDSSNHGAGYFEPDNDSYLISLFGKGMYQEQEVSCSILFKVIIRND